MGKKAIDIVLLPPETVMDIAISINKQLVKDSASQIILNKQNCLPHISLAMGGVNEENIPHIQWILKAIIKENPPTTLTVSRIIISTNAKGQKVSLLTLEKTEKLQLLHEKIMKKLTCYLTYNVTSDMVNSTEVDESTLLWINSYRDKSAFTNFSPHITIAYGQIDKTIPTLKFKPSKLAICHLGNHCTCTKILAEIEF